MGHITFVGPSMGIVEARLQSMLTEEIKDDQPAGQLCCLTLSFIVRVKICGLSQVTTVLESMIWMDNE